jgi:hypothetical protein
VIDHRCGRDLPERLAHAAERMPSEKQLTGLAPLPPVKLSSRRLYGHSFRS